MANTNQPSVDTTERPLMVSTSEIARMDDARALAKIDQLREAAHEADAAGRARDARAYLHNAVQVSEHSYLATDVIAEYADYLEGHGFPEFAAEYRKEHERVASELAGLEGTLPSYEERLRSERRTVSDDRQRLGDVVGQARSASTLMGAQARSHAHLQLVEGRG